MRYDRLNINNAAGLRAIKQDLRDMLKQQHTLALQGMNEAADYIYVEAFARVPVKTGELQDSIYVDVSRSPRYPGIVAIATARNPKTNYDYAYIQEVNEDYHHSVGQAHYLEEPFREAVDMFYKKMGWQ